MSIFSWINDWLTKPPQEELPNESRVVICPYCYEEVEINQKLQIGPLHQKCPECFENFKVIANWTVVKW